MQFKPPATAATPFANLLTPWRRAPALLVVCAMAASCSEPLPWDREYACTGQEQSVSSSAGDDPAMAIHKTFPRTIDFHLRLPNALVKSRQVVVDSTVDGVIHFSGREPSSWMAGHFHLQTGELDVIDEIALTIAGRAQLTRTSGQYSCQASARARTA